MYALCVVKITCTFNASESVFNDSINLRWLSVCCDVSGSSIAYIIPVLSPSENLLSTSPRKKLSKTKRFTPLPLLFIGISSSPDIETPLKTSCHFNA